MKPKTPNTPFEDIEEDESLETGSIKSVEERGNEDDCDTNMDTPDPIASLKCTMIYTVFYTPTTNCP
jgi:hypothetical protein